MDAEGSTLIGSFTLGSSSSSSQKRKTVSFEEQPAKSAKTSPSQPIRNIKDLVPQVDLGPCTGVRCADAGVALKPEDVKKGRLREITEIAQHATWDYVFPGDCRDGKTVKMRWVDRQNRKTGGVKSRLCAMGFAWDLRNGPLGQREAASADGDRLNLRLL